jgi:hypothetical protein
VHVFGDVDFVDDQQVGFDDAGMPQSSVPQNI